jgi:hypothetical protein
MQVYILILAVVQIIMLLIVFGVALRCKSYMGAIIALLLAGFVELNTFLQLEAGAVFIGTVFVFILSWYIINNIKRGR